MIVLASLAVTFVLTGHPISHIDMLVGMGLGMSSVPIMMEAIKRGRTKRRVNKLLAEIVRLREEKTSIEGKLEVQEEPLVL